MNNELFDRIIKDSLSEVKATPSSGLKKAVSRKVFFQNLIVFHKVKILVGLFLIGGGLTATAYLDGSGSSSEEISRSNKVTNSNITEKLQISNNNSAENGIKENLISVNNEPKSTNSDNDLTLNLGTDENNIVPLNPEEANQDNESSHVYTSETNASNEESEGNFDSQTDVNLVENNLEETNIEDHQTIEPDYESNFTGIETESLIVDKESATYKMEKAPLFKAEKQNSSIAIDYLNTPESVILPDFGRQLFSELSFDLYVGAMGQSNVSNRLKSALHQHYYWDFYGEQGNLSSNDFGGINVNYSMGGQVFRGKISGGVGYSEIYESKAVYEFGEVTDPDWLEFFGVEQLGWVNTYGKDTCKQCFSAPNSDELQVQLEEKYNNYSYLEIPLQIGTEINLGRASLDLMGGIQWNILTDAKGLYVKPEEYLEGEKFFYWDHLELSTLNRDNEMLKTNFINWTASANLRIRITKNFDLLAGYQIGKSYDEITKKTYLIDKSLSYSHAKFGISYFPSRTKLNPKF